MYRQCTSDISCTNVLMDIIADTNIFLAIALNEPEKKRIIQFTSGVNIIAPEILPYEIGNALSAMTKRKQVTHDEALSAQKTVASIPVRLIGVDVQHSLKIALDYDIYAYDAYFLRCAIFLNAPLMTLDKRLQKVATKLNIKVLA
mgnify:FL=1